MYQLASGRIMETGDKRSRLVLAERVILVNHLYGVDEECESLVADWLGRGCERGGRDDGCCYFHRFELYLTIGKIAVKCRRPGFRSGRSRPRAISHRIIVIRREISINQVGQVGDQLRARLVSPFRWVEDELTDGRVVSGFLGSLVFRGVGGPTLRLAQSTTTWMYFRSPACKSDWEEFTA